MAAAPPVTSQDQVVAMAVVITVAAACARHRQYGTAGNQYHAAHDQHDAANDVARADGRRSSA